MYYTTEMYPLNPSNKHLFAFIFISKNLFLFMVTCEDLFVYKNLFLSMIISKNLIEPFLCAKISSY